MVTKNSDCQELAHRFEKMAADGLLDVKFYVADEATTELVCREVTRLYDALDAGEFAPLDFKDSRR